MSHTCCISVSTVLYFIDASTRTGLFRDARCSLATLDVIVALNKYVVRSRGMCCTTIQHGRRTHHSHTQSQAQTHTLELQPCAVTHSHRQRPTQSQTHAHRH